MVGKRITEPDFSAFHAIAAQLSTLQKQAEQEYSVVVKDLIRSNCQDSNRIAHTLDGLLGFANDGECLLLYRLLYKHLFAFDPQCAADYIEYWSEMWDEYRERFGKKLILNPTTHETYTCPQPSPPQL